MSDLDAKLSQIRNCDLCRNKPLYGAPLPHAAKPILQASAKAQLAIFSQAPGNKAHQSGTPFLDPSGDRLRDWLQLDHETFYDRSKVAIVPMGFCFPGYDKHGGDKPPRKECAQTWHDELLPMLTGFRLVLLIGSYSQAYHNPEWSKMKVGERVRMGAFQKTLISGQRVTMMALPHPSWRNNAWINANPWFNEEVLSVLREEMAALFKN